MSGDKESVLKHYENALSDPVVEPWEVMVEKMDVGLYDTLLENREVRS